MYNRAYKITYLLMYAFSFTDLVTSRKHICRTRSFIVIHSAVFNISFFFYRVPLVISSAILCISWLKMTILKSINGQKFLETDSEIIIQKKKNLLRSIVFIRIRFDIYISNLCRNSGNFSCLSFVATKL